MSRIQRSSVDLNFSTIRYKNGEGVWAKSEVDGLWYQAVIIGRHVTPKIVDPSGDSHQDATAEFVVVFQKKIKGSLNAREVVRGDHLMPAGDPIAASRATAANIKSSTRKNSSSN